jgi:hypothetical protein
VDGVGEKHRDAQQACANRDMEPVGIDFGISRQRGEERAGMSMKEGRLRPGGMSQSREIQVDWRCPAKDSESPLKACRTQCSFWASKVMWFSLSIAQHPLVARATQRLFHFLEVRNQPGGVVRQVFFDWNGEACWREVEKIKNGTHCWAVVVE